MSSPVDRSSDPNRRSQPRELLNTAEVAARFSVHPNTVTRWHNSGKIGGLRTLGGHRRYYADEIEKMVDPNNG